MGKHNAATDEPGHGGRPLVITADENLLDDVLRLATVSSVEVDVVADAGSARLRWTDASIVILDDALVEPLVSLGVSRRAGVIVVGRDLDDADVWRRAVNVGADHVVFLPDAAEWLIEQLSRPVVGSDQAQVVAVLSACGGVGASTLSATLATRAMGRDLGPILVDADPLGGGIDLLLGAEAAPGIRWADLAHAEGCLNSQSLVEALPNDHGLPFLSWSQSVSKVVAPATYDHVLSALVRDDRLVVVDLGRSTGSLADQVLTVASTTILLVPARVRAVAAASAMVRRIGASAASGGSLGLVVRRPAPAGLDEATIARALALPLVGSLAHDGRRAEWEENGLPPTTRGTWSRVCDAILDFDQEATQAA